MRFKGRFIGFLMQPLISCPSIRLKNKTCWKKNQYPEEWSSKIVKHTLEKVTCGGKDLLRTTPKGHQKTNYFSTIQMQPYSKLCKQIEKTMPIASGFYNAEVKIMPPHPEIIFR